MEISWDDRWTIVMLCPRQNDFWVPDGDQTHNLLMRKPEEAEDRAWRSFIYHLKISPSSHTSKIFISMFQVFVNNTVPLMFLSLIPIFRRKKQLKLLSAKHLARSNVCSLQRNRTLIVVKFKGKNQKAKILYNLLSEVVSILNNTSMC